MTDAKLQRLVSTPKFGSDCSEEESCMTDDEIMREYIAVQRYNDTLRQENAMLQQTFDEGELNHKCREFFPEVDDNYVEHCRLADRLRKLERLLSTAREAQRVREEQLVRALKVVTDLKSSLNNSDRGRAEREIMAILNSGPPITVPVKLKEPLLDDSVEVCSISTAPEVTSCDQRETFDVILQDTRKYGPRKVSKFGFPGLHEGEPDVLLAKLDTMIARIDKTVRLVEGSHSRLPGSDMAKLHRLQAWKPVLYRNRDQSRDFHRVDNWSPPRRIESVSEWKPVLYSKPRP